jgi:hypothetical protein
MTMTPPGGDVLIRPFGESSYQLLDMATREQIAIVPELPLAIKVASDRGGAVWRENVDDRGRPIGNPVLLQRAKCHSPEDGVSHS